MELYRPVGEIEYRQIEASGFRGFPPRGDQQPIFHLILQQRFAEEVAQGWQDAEICHVVRFYIDDAYVSAFPVQTVGGEDRQELWVPADELQIFNEHILGAVSLVKSIRPTRDARAERAPLQSRCAGFV